MTSPRLHKTRTRTWIGSSPNGAFPRLPPSQPAGSDSSHTTAATSQDQARSHKDSDMPPVSPTTLTTADFAVIEALTSDQHNSLHLFLKNDSSPPPGDHDAGIATPSNNAEPSPPSSLSSPRAPLFPPSPLSPLFPPSPTTSRPASPSAADATLASPPPPSRVPGVWKWQCHHCRHRQPMTVSKCLKCGHHRCRLQLRNQGKSVERRQRGRAKVAPLISESRLRYSINTDKCQHGKDDEGSSDEDLGMSASRDPGWNDRGRAMKRHENEVRSERRASTGSLSSFAAEPVAPVEHRDILDEPTTRAAQETSDIAEQTDVELNDTAAAEIAPTEIADPEICETDSVNGMASKIEAKASSIVKMTSVTSISAQEASASHATISPKELQAYDSLPTSPVSTIAASPPASLRPSQDSFPPPSRSPPPPPTRMPPPPPPPPHSSPPSLVQTPPRPPTPHLSVPTAQEQAAYHKRKRSQTNSCVEHLDYAGWADWGEYRREAKRRRITRDMEIERSEQERWARECKALIAAHEDRHVAEMSLSNEETYPTGPLESHDASVKTGVAMVGDGSDNGNDILSVDDGEDAEGEIDEDWLAIAMLSDPNPHSYTLSPITSQAQLAQSAPQMATFADGSITTITTTIPLPPRPPVRNWSLSFAPDCSIDCEYPFQCRRKRTSEASEREWHQRHIEKDGYGQFYSQKLGLVIK